MRKTGREVWIASYLARWSMREAARRRCLSDELSKCEFRSVKRPREDLNCALVQERKEPASAYFCWIS